MPFWCTDAPFLICYSQVSVHFCSICSFCSQWGVALCEATSCSKAYSYKRQSCIKPSFALMRITRHTSKSGRQNGSLLLTGSSDRSNSNGAPCHPGSSFSQALAMTCMRGQKCRRVCAWVCVCMYMCLHACLCVCLCMYVAKSVSAQGCMHVQHCKYGPLCKVRVCCNAR